MSRPETVHNVANSAPNEAKDTEKAAANLEGRALEKDLILPPQSAASQDAWKPTVRDKLAMLALMVISLLAALDTAVLTPALPTITRELQGTATDAFWAGTSYLLAFTVFQLSIASASHLVGKRVQLVLSVCFFTVGSILSAASQNFAELLAGRSIQGIGGGGITSLVNMSFTDIVPLRQRPKYLGLIQLVYAFASILGPVIGGSIAQHATWRWIFYLNLPICGIGLGLLTLTLKEVPKEAPTSALLLFDWTGCLLFTCSLASLLLGLTWGGIQFPWHSGQTILPVVLGGCGLFFTLVWEAKGAHRPLLNLALFNTSGAGVYPSSLLQGLILFSQLFYLVVWLQSVRQMSPTLSGLGQLAIAGTMCPSGIIVGLVVTRLGHFRWAVWVGWAAVILGTGMSIAFTTTTTNAYWIVALLILGAGHGMLISALNFAAQRTAKTGATADAAAMYVFMRTLGTCLGMVVGGTILQNEISQALDAVGVSSGATENSIGFISELEGLSVESLRVVLDGYTAGFRLLFIVLTVVAAIGGLLSMLIERQ